ncbi:21 kDa protein-like [Panicum miliaceum]|uniref:21 kDa protein-like n=1 Tax=Panicum miliaceum TaxID=4540 RepID=A0A3L6R0F6_PANMI|nr:21 kDa protein-like [Panicum miliaceum]
MDNLKECSVIPTVPVFQFPHARGGEGKAACRGGRGGGGVLTVGGRASGGGAAPAVGKTAIQARGSSTRGLGSCGEVDGCKGGAGGGGGRARLLRAHALPVHSGLALASANLKLAALCPLVARIPPPSSAGLNDCVEAIALAGRLRGVEQAVGLEVLWRVDDKLTWLSAAMTDKDTCADGLWPWNSALASVSAELRARVRRAKQYTSIALALVNMLIETLRAQNVHGHMRPAQRLVLQQ